VQFESQFKQTRVLQQYQCLIAGNKLVVSMGHTKAWLAGIWIKLPNPAAATAAPLVLLLIHAAAATGVARPERADCL